MNEKIFALRLRLESMQTELQALLELDTSDAASQLNKLLDAVKQVKSSLRNVDSSDFEQLSKDVAELESNIRRAVSAKAAMSNQSRVVSADLDVMKKAVSDVQRNLLFIVRDAPYGFMGVANNIEVLIDTLSRLKAQSIATGQSVSALGLIFRGITSLLTSPAGIISLVITLVLSLKDMGSILNRLTSGAVAEFMYSLRELGKAIGVVDDFREGFEKLKDLLSEKVTLENLQTGFKLLRMQALSLEEQNAELDKQIAKRKEIIETESASNSLTVRRREALQREIESLEKKKKKNETILLSIKEQLLREGEIREKLEGELEARERIALAFRDKGKEIKRRYEEELMLNEKIRDELLRRQDNLQAKSRELAAELKRQDDLLAKSAITRRDYEDEVLRIKKEQATLERERLEVEAELLRRNATFRLETEASLARASALRIRDELLRQEQLAKIEIARNAKLLELQKKLRSQGALTQGEYEKERASLIEAQAKLRAELIEIENKKIQRNIDLRKRALELQVQLTEKQKEQALRQLEASAQRAETMYDTDIGSERLILATEELIRLKKEELELDIRRRELSNEIFDAGIERAMLELKIEEMRAQTLQKIDEIRAKQDERRKRRYADAFNQLLRAEESLLDVEEMREKRDIVSGSLFREDAQFRMNEAALRRIEMRLQAAKRALELARAFGTAEEIMQAERNLAALELRLAEMQSTQISAMSFLQVFGSGLAQALEQQIRFNSQSAELERERTRNQLAEERRRVAERRAILEKEYEDVVSLLNEQIGMQQISQAEAARRLSEFEQKRLNELESLRQRETEIIQREQRLQSQSFARSVTVNITNAMVQLVAQMLLAEAASGRLNLLTAAFVVPATIAASAAIKGMLESMLVSYAEGRMFERPTAIRAVVGDAQKAGQPVNIEALLNAAQLAEFGRRYAAERSQTVIVNLHAELNATKLVEEFEEQKIVYAKLKTR